MEKSVIKCFKYLKMNETGDKRRSELLPDETKRYINIRRLTNYVSLQNLNSSPDYRDTTQLIRLRSSSSSVQPGLIRVGTSTTGKIHYVLTKMENALSDGQILYFRSAFMSKPWRVRNNFPWSQNLISWLRFYVSELSPSKFLGNIVDRSLSAEFIRWKHLSGGLNRKVDCRHVERFIYIWEIPFQSSDTQWELNWWSAIIETLTKYPIE